MKRSSIVRFVAACLLGAGPVGDALAQDYPTKPIRVIVGPGPDVLARIVGERLGESLGKPVIVEQRPAAGGAIAADTVAKSPPDGYTLLLSTGSFTINQALSPVGYDMERDFTPVSLMATLPFILVVRPDAPAQSLKALLDRARAEPGKLNYASAGNGTPPHLAGELLKQMARVDIVHVPYKGVAPAVSDMLGGQVQMMFAVSPAGLPLVKAGKLRALAVSSGKRYSMLPDVPTVAESGFAGFQVVGWNGLHAPAKTPRAIVERLNAEVARILKEPNVAERAAAAGFEPVGSTIDEAAKFVRDDLARSGAIVKLANIKPD